MISEFDEDIEEMFIDFTNNPNRKDYDKLECKIINETHL